MSEFLLELCFAPRPEWSSFCEEERRTEKRERRTEKGAQIKLFPYPFRFLCFLFGFRNVDGFLRSII